MNVQIHSSKKKIITCKMSKTPKKSLGWLLSKLSWFCQNQCVPFVWPDSCCSQHAFVISQLAPYLPPTAPRVASKLPAFPNAAYFQTTGACIGRDSRTRARTCSPENLADLAKWSRHGVSVRVQVVWSLILPDCWHNPDVKMQQEKHEKKKKNYFQSSVCYHFALFNAFLYRKEPKAIVLMAWSIFIKKR